MKKIFLFLILIILAVPSISFATSGACSSHNGVNCSMAMQPNGKVYCNDGWTESITDYDFTAICKNNNKLQLGCNQEQWDGLLKKYEIQNILDKMDKLDQQLYALIEAHSTDVNLAKQIATQHQYLEFDYNSNYKQAEIGCTVLGDAIRVELKQKLEQTKLDYNNKQTDEQTKLYNLNMAKLETDLQNLKDKLANYCTDTYGINSITLSPGKCSCNTGYVLGKENKCIAISNWCSELSNTYMKNGTCTCLDGYSYDSNSKTCKILEIKKAVAQPIVIKNIPINTTPTIKPSDSLKNPVKNEFLNSVVLPKEEITPQITIEPVKKLKWYQKIFNWFKGK